MLNDQELKDLVAAAEFQEYMTIGADAKKPARERAVAIRTLQSTYPDKAGALLPLLPALEAKADKIEADEQRKTVAAERARRKKEGVTLGMSEEEVLQSSWGKPDKVNRSHGSWGVHEQWVYRNRVSGYLYFENGKLTSVQN